MNYKKIVLAYSGGLDTSVIITWLKENYKGCEVIAVTADVGQGEDELEGLEEKAKKTGASKIYILDLKEEMVNDYIVPTIKAGATYENVYLLGTPFSRPLIAKKLVEIAKKENADAICHGCTGKGNDQVRFELGIKAFAPDMPVIVPWRTWEIKSREDEIEYAEKHRLVGMKSRGVYETPGGTIIYKAHELLESICLDKETAHYKQSVADKFGELLYNAGWFSPLREALSAFVDKTQENVTGEVGLKLYKGNIISNGISSPYSLYSEKMASFGEDDDFDQEDSKGFINLYGLPTKVRSKMMESKK